VVGGQRRIDLLELLRIVDALDADPRRVFMDIVGRRAGGEARRAAAATIVVTRVTGWRA